MARATNGYVEHPRYGRAPRFTGLDADMESAEVNLHYRLRLYTKPMLNYFLRGGWQIPLIDDDGPTIVPGTAILADLTRQTPATIPVTHYYDEERRCWDCHRYFLFYAEEQRYWYEELQFSLDSNCVRCYPCRKRQQDVKKTKLDYDAMRALAEPTVDELARMAFTRLVFVEEGHFHVRQLEHVRCFLRLHPDHEKSAMIRARLEAMARTSENQSAKSKKS